MINQIIPGKLKTTLSDAEKAEIKGNIDKGMSSLVGVIPGLVSSEVRTECLPSSNCDVMLESRFETVEALNAYRIDARHNAVADKYVRPYVETRLCFDHED